MRTLTKWLVLLLAVAMLGAACGGGDDAGNGDDGGTQPTGTETTDGGEQGDGATVRMLDFSFDPASLAVSAGDEVELVNAGEAPHTFTVEDTEVDVEVAADESGTATIDLEPGDYEFICRFHPQMTGQLTVS